ncbi:unnamed protein product [Mytilus coruscus]|uniref:Farnesoic acid O-methyl transferase domain-containing protein n=1 Tax=Mytilus coruscus TaxID=42192 RepID=A0A6J8E1Y0_MYTCO|nr:unnamed protein product [Mytilus coruscus]
MVERSYERGEDMGKNSDRGRGETEMIVGREWKRARDIYRTTENNEYKSLEENGVHFQNSESIYFKVKSCDGAFIDLMDDSSSTENNNPVYRVHFEKEQSTIIENSSESILAKETWSGLDCNCYVSIWVSWNSETIEAGKGTVIGSDKFISSTAKIDVIDILIMSHTVAYWQFNFPKNATSGHKKTFSLELECTVLSLHFNPFVACTPDPTTMINTTTTTRGLDPTATSNNKTTTQGLDPTTTSNTKTTTQGLDPITASNTTTTTPELDPTTTSNTTTITQGLDPTTKQGLIPTTTSNTTTTTQGLDPTTTSNTTTTTQGLDPITTSNTTTTTQGLDPTTTSKTTTTTQGLDPKTTSNTTTTTQGFDPTTTSNTTTTTQGLDPTATSNTTTTTQGLDPTNKHNRNKYSRI